MTDKERCIFSKEPWWDRRSKLEKKLLIALLALLVVYIGCSLIVAIKYIVPSKPCNTDECLLAASQIVNSIDPSVDPCEDFFRFACGKFIEQIHGDIKATSIKSLEEQVERQVAELIREPIKKSDHPSVKIQKKIFQNCMNETEAEQNETLHIFNKTLGDLHGWPVVEGFTWNEQLFDWKEAVYTLRGSGYPYQFFFDVTVNPDLKNKTRNAVYISEPYVTAIKKEHKELYKEYMVEVAMAFGAEKNLAIVEMEKVADFQERLGNIVKKNRFDDENATDTSYKSHLLSRRFTVAEFQKSYDEIDWLSFVNGILKPAAKISKTDHVFFAKDELLKEALTLLEKTPRRILANYIIWNLVEHVIGYLSEDLQQLEEKFYCVTSARSSLKDRFKYCKRIINGSFRPSPVYVNYARKYLPTDKKNKVEDILRRIKLEFLELLKDADWMDSESVEKALEKANAITEILGMPGDYSNDAIYNSFGSDPKFPDEIQDLNFLQVLLINMKHRDDFLFSRVNKVNDESSKSITYQSIIATVNAMYSPTDNIIILPVAILQGIFYDPNRPQYLNYGSLGSIIGHELTHGFCKEASKFDKHGNEDVTMWTNKTMAAYEEKVRCIIKDAEEFDVTDTEYSINGTQTLEENIADYTGVKVAYAAYKDWVSEHGEEPRLTGVKYTPNQLFWISSISHECYELSGKSLERSLKHDSHALNVFRAIAPIKNSVEFAVDFNCPLNSNMNPKNKCRVF